MILRSDFLIHFEYLLLTMAASNDFLSSDAEMKVIFEFTNHAGKKGRMVCTITNRQIKGFEQYCIPKCCIRDHWITIKYILEDCRLSKKLPIGFSHPVSGKQILEYIAYCQTGKYDEKKHNHPSYAMLADFMGDELFLDDFGKFCRPQLWSDEETVMYHHIFWAYVYLPYLNETFYLNIPRENKELTRYLRKIEYEKIDRSDPFWILTVDFDGLLDTEEYMGDRWITRATMVQHVSRKKKFSHRKCLYRFLTFNPLIAKKVLEDDPCVLICDTNLATKLRKRVMNQTYDDILKMTEKELENKTPGITCWTEEDERRWREFGGSKLGYGEYNELEKMAKSRDKLNRSLMEIRQRHNERRKLLGLSECWSSSLSMNNPWAGRLSILDQAEEAKTNKKVENYQKQQSANQKKKNKQRKNDEANQCYQGPTNPKPKILVL